jgi:N-acetylmuramoyl-L-alanine amidase/Putative peptidoglycan binding domain
VGPLSRRGLLLGGLTLAGTGLLGGGLRPDQAWAIGGPEIISCDGWGARRNRGVLPVYDRRPVKILVHHTATPNQKATTRDAAVRLARSIQGFHMDRRGWPDTGQHFTVSRGGIVLEGRHRSLEFVRVGRWQVEGAHCTGQNVVALGIENEGTYSAVDPPGVLWNNLRSLCAYLCGQYGIKPTAIYGHRDFKDTACPGDRLYAAIPRLRSEVAGLLGKKVSKATVSTAAWPLLRIADRGERVLAAQHLLRAAGVPVVADGRFTRELADAVRAFQAERGFGLDDPDLDSTDGPTGMIGGESWPVLARPVRAGEGGEAQQAVEVLLRGRDERVPDVVTPEIWQRLLAR